MVRMETGKGQIVRTFNGESVTIHSNRQTVSNLSYAEGIALGAGETYKVAGRASDMDLNEIDEVW